MRIQHNIMAMGAYRNYTNNVGAMKKNLEKLSSGYKINRAGDDAAGLAISEKMRAQITGLETAQKNAKDGISLVQTAEGALTEVHDMLNRMVELATQSANGTYDNTTDRNQMQKELDQLRSEIDRIADSSNFNGIKLLDGSMSSAAAGAVSNITATGFEKATDFLDAIKFEYVTNRPDTAAGGSDKASFEISLDDFAVSGGTAADTQTFILKIGTKTITAMNTGTSWTASAMAAALAKAGDGVGMNSDAKTIKTSATATTKAFLMIDGHAYKMSATSGTIKFTQQDSMDSNSAPVNPSFEVNGTLNASSAKAGFSAVGTLNTQVQVTKSGVAEANQHQAQAEATIDFSKLKQGDYMKVGDITYKFSFEPLASTAALYDSTNKVKTIDLSGLQEKLDSGEITEKEFQERAMVKITEQMAVNTGTAGTPNTTAVNDEWSVGNGGVKNGVGTLTFQSKSSKPNTSIDLNNEAKVMARFSAGAPANAAKTTFDLDVTKIKAGDTITVDGVTFEFTTGATSSNPNNKVINLSSLGLQDGLTSSQTQDVVDKLKTAIEGVKYGDNSARFTVSNNGSKVTISTVDLAATTDVVESQTAPKISATGTGGMGLTLQIGDTADSYNQLKVDIGDTHVAALGLDKINIADQEDAQAAIDTIKAAINQVSDIRGTLGATQNRLDHTINNLSVMTENIQDAESTIRDTDVAAEMMEYTKNNILIQSAQAMLAQANQVPQGVLQLLQ